MHRNCHLDRAFSLLPRRRLGRMNAADRPTKSLVEFPNFGCGFDSHRPAPENKALRLLPHSIIFKSTQIRAFFSRIVDRTFPVESRKRCK
jgi:hypothetical protein